MSSRQLWIAVLVTAVAVRLLTLSAYPLHDTTEARYAEIARLMVVSGDWIMPQIEPGVPFWGKPPLSIWLTAASFELLGFSEFAARLPAYLLMLGTAVLTFRIGKEFYSEKAALVACVILVSSVLGFVASGAVMTDAALMFATTLSLMSFCLAVRDPTALSRYGFFVGLGLGLLAKGPIALVLVGVPTLLWSLWQKNLSWLWRALPWATGTLLMLAIAGPWYLLAEIRSPGFLEYFLLGEHWLRFVETGWQGNLYGHAHSRPHGTIVIYAIAAALPWSIVALYAGVQALKGKSPLRSLTPVQAYLLLWTLTPLLFFTFAGNVLAAYVLPAMPAFALLLGGWISGRNRSLAYAGWLVPCLVAIAVMAGFSDDIAYRSQRDVIEHHSANSPSSDLYYFLKLPHSASFYSAGAAMIIPSKPALAEFLSSENEGFIAVRKKYANDLPKNADGCLSTTRRFGDFSLLEKHGQCGLRDSQIL